MICLTSFSINMMVGSMITEQLKRSGDIGFHFSVRFNERLVVRNSRQNNVWGPEEREPRVMPFVAGRDFEAMILCEESAYKVAVNGKHFIEFLHRVPLSCCGVVNIDGHVEVDRIECRREMRYVPYNNPLPVLNPNLPNFPPIYNPSLPFHQKFTQGLNPGFMVYISGRLTHSPDRFSIDFLSETPSDKDIAFHISVRMKDSVVVRNSYQRRRWNEEERQIPHFPFYAGVNFDLIIRVETHRYMMAVNGQHFIEFNHRFPPNFVNGLAISGDAIIASVRFAQEVGRQ